MWERGDVALFELEIAVLKFQSRDERRVDFKRLGELEVAIHKFLSRDEGRVDLKRFRIAIDTLKQIISAEERAQRFRSADQGHLDRS